VPFRFKFESNRGRWRPADSCLGLAAFWPGADRAARRQDPWQGPAPRAMV